MRNWKRTYNVIWMAQFLSILGFAFALPFAPYYIQELGVTDPAAVKIWVALFAAATPLTLALSSPLWGAASDRFGYRIMMLRANFCAVGVLGMMGLVRSVEALIVLRLLQGALTGTLTASQIMVAAYAPPEQSGRALGSLNAAVFSGAMCGAALGGLSSALLGYRVVFTIAAAAVLCSGLLILFGTPREEPHASRKEPASPDATAPTSQRAFMKVLPLLGLMTGASFVRQFDMAMMPLLVQEIHGSLKGVSLYTGALLAVSSVAGLLAGILLGRLADRVAPATIAVYVALAAGIFMIPQGQATAIWMLYPARFGMMFCTGGLESVSQIWLAKATPRQFKGILFGWAGTARAVGWVGAPLVSGVIGASFGIRPVYYVGAILFVLLVPLIVYTRRRTKMIAAIPPLSPGKACADQRDDGAVPAPRA